MNDNFAMMTPLRFHVHVMILTSVPKVYSNGTFVLVNETAIGMHSALNWMMICAKSVPFMHNMWPRNTEI